MNALENVLVKLYLESPLAGSAMPSGDGLGIDMTGMGPIGGTHMAINDVGDIDGMGCMMGDAGLEISRGHNDPRVHSQTHGL